MLVDVVYSPWEWLSAWFGCLFRSAPARSAGLESCWRHWEGDSGASWACRAESSSLAVWPGPQEHKMKLLKQWTGKVLYLLSVFDWLKQVYPTITTLVFPLFYVLLWENNREIKLTFFCWSNTYLLLIYLLQEKRFVSVQRNLPYIVYNTLNNTPEDWAAVFLYHAQRRWSPPPTPGL